MLSVNLSKALIVALFATSLLHGTEAPSDMTQMQKFYYDLGRKSAKAEYIKKGYKLALGDFKRTISKYKEMVKAQEAGKYLLEEGKITYPRIYKIKENGTYRIKIEAPKVERTFSAEDLFLVPLYKKYDGFGGSDDTMETVVPTIREVSTPTSSSITPPPPATTIASAPRNPNAFDLPDLNSIAGNKTARPKTPGRVQDKTTLYIPYKSSTVEGFLSSYGASYSETSKGYRILFSNEREKKRFCLQLSGDETCQSIVK